MNLYLVAYDKNFHLLFTKKWIRTESLLETNELIKQNHNTDCEIYFPTLSGTDWSNIKYSGKTVLLFTNDAYYFLHDIENESCKGILRDIAIDEILEN